MGMRYDAETSDVSPDAASYSTAINAWARSRETDAVERAEEILASCEESYRLGNRKAKPNTLTYNSIINCYSKSNVASAAEMAISMLESMREKCTTEGFEDCCPDVVTYTSVIDTLAKQKNAKAAEKAIVLLEDLESAYKISPEDQRLKPNVRTYTSVSRFHRK